MCRYAPHLLIYFFKKVFFFTAGKIPLPPVLMGQLGSDPKKKTLLVYGHLDVQPALKEDGWDYEPFVLTKDGDKLYGRGSTDDKGPVLGWLHVIQAFQVSTTVKYSLLNGLYIMIRIDM